MMVWECTSTCYVLFWIVVVPVGDLGTYPWNVEPCLSSKAQR
jgi:hypothetical protein